MGHTAPAELPQWYKDTTAPGTPPVDALPDRCGRVGDKAAGRQLDALSFLLHRWFVKWPRAAAVRAAKRAAAQNASKKWMAAMEGDHPEHRTIVTRHGTRNTTKQKLTDEGGSEKVTTGKVAANSNANATVAKTRFIGY